MATSKPADHHKLHPFSCINKPVMKHKTSSKKYKLAHNNKYVACLLTFLGKCVRYNITVLGYTVKAIKISLSVWFMTL
jgi:hypothetical protein